MRITTEGLTGWKVVAEWLGAERTVHTGAGEGVNALRACQEFVIEAEGGVVTAMKRCKVCGLGGFRSTELDYCDEGGPGGACAECIGTLR